MSRRLDRPVPVGLDLRRDPAASGNDIPSGVDFDEGKREMTLRIGIDVGGTNTDAVLMDDLQVVAKIKTPTTADVTSGITTALRHVLDTSGTATAQVAGV